MDWPVGLSRLMTTDPRSGSHAPEPGTSARAYLCSDLWRNPTRTTALVLESLWWHLGAKPLLGAARYRSPNLGTRASATVTGRSQGWLQGRPRTCPGSLCPGTRMHRPPSCDAGASQCCPAGPRARHAFHPSRTRSPCRPASWESATAWGWSCARAECLSRSSGFAQDGRLLPTNRTARHLDPDRGEQSINALGPPQRETASPLHGHLPRATTDHSWHKHS
mmetsp:Transcript_47101/g.102457  ORF Transcript_47101/g.102457 Transcript_47101/m.102457 type:complete len:221 (-) Transcript_47101:7-669(-)